MILLCFGLVSGAAIAQHDSTTHQMDKKIDPNMSSMDHNFAMFKDAKLGTACQHYIHVKDAFVASNQTEARNMAGELQTALASVSNGKRAADKAAQLLSASTLADQREAFEGLSNEMTTLVKGGKLSMGMIYLAYCPMVKASWLSNEQEIKNPYYGDKMMKCGSVKEMIH